MKTVQNKKLTVSEAGCTDELWIIDNTQTSLPRSFLSQFSIDVTDNIIQIVQFLIG